MLGKVTKVLNAVSATVNSAEIETGRSFDPVGIVQVAAGAGNWTLLVRGRVSLQSDCPLFTIATITQADLVSGSYIQAIDIYPLMRFDLTVSSGSPALSCWAGF